jgi:hypothetical protein
VANGPARARHLVPTIVAKVGCRSLAPQLTPHLRLLFAILPRRYKASAVDFDHPQLELVGAWVHSAAKDGLDLGPMVGRDPVRVQATTDAERLYDLEADYVVYSPFMADPRVVAALLRSGKNVVTPLGWFYPPGRPAPGT